MLRKESGRSWSALPWILREPTEAALRQRLGFRNVMSDESVTSAQVTGAQSTHTGRRARLAALGVRGAGVRVVRLRSLCPGRLLASSAQGSGRKTERCASRSPGWGRAGRRQQTEPLLSGFLPAMAGAQAAPRVPSDATFPRWSVHRLHATSLEVPAGSTPIL